MNCVICNEKTDLESHGICVNCQKKICEALGMTVEFLDEDPYVKVTPKDKQPLYNLVYAISEAIGLANRNFHAVKHHTHSTKQVEVVNIE